MKKIITLAAIVVAVAGVFVAKANENKLFADATAVYIDNNASGNGLTLFASAPPSFFKTAITGTQATIVDKDGNSHNLWQNANEKPLFISSHNNLIKLAVHGTANFINYFIFFQKFCPNNILKLLLEFSNHISIRARLLRW
jgi:hypothetical protein